jgi:hypothetical protein
VLNYWQSFRFDDTGIQEKSMRAMLVFVLSVFFVSNDLSAQNDLKSICERTGRDKKIVMKLERKGLVKLCRLASYQESGEEECESGYGGTQSWKLIVDLNKDKHYDVLVASSSGRWLGAYPHSFFVNCGDDTFIDIFATYFTEIKVIQPANNTEWLQFKTRVFDPNPEEDSTGEINDYVLKFDKKKFTYIETQTRSIKGPEISSTQQTVMPNLNIPWDRFPSNLPPLVTDDGTKDACKNTRRLMKFSPSPKSTVSQGYVNLCHVSAEGGPCIASDKDQTNYARYGGPVGEKGVWKPSNSTGLYGWYGRYLFLPDGGSPNTPDLIAFSRNPTSEIHGFGVYINCGLYGASGYLEIMKGSFTDVKHDKPDEKHLFADIHATRHCPNKSTGQLQSRTFVLKFDPTKFEYGPPNGDPALVTPCSDKEMALPFKVVK